MSTTRKQRIALSFYFLLSGFCFSTWASRIPTIKENFDLNEAELGNLLLTMPISSLIGLPISGWLVSRFNSRVPMVISFCVFALSLATIGFAQNIAVLVIAIFSFSFCMRILNISLNTQSITLQKKYGKTILGSFHGVWSGGGVLGVGFSTLMVKYNVAMPYHLLSISIFVLIVALPMYRWLIKQDKATSGNKIKIGKPDKFILSLGLLVFFAAICEGGMFDWTGVYFKEIVGQDVFTLGHLSFMIFMAISRFMSDKIIDRIGKERTYILSSITIVCGILIAILLPYFWPVLIGFGMVGLGAAAIFPMTFGLAGKSEKYSAGMAVSIISTYSIVGMLLGPPLVGYLAHAFNLKVAFVLFLFAGLMFIPISQMFFRFMRKENQ